MGFRSLSSVCETLQISDEPHHLFGSGGEFLNVAIQVTRDPCGRHQNVQLGPYSLTENGNLFDIVLGDSLAHASSASRT
jgi:hypothetical protein